MQVVPDKVRLLMQVEQVVRDVQVLQTVIQGWQRVPEKVKPDWQPVQTEKDVQPEQPVGQFTQVGGVEEVLYWLELQAQ